MGTEDARSHAQATCASMAFIQKCTRCMYVLMQTKCQCSKDKKTTELARPVRFSANAFYGEYKKVLIKLVAFVMTEVIAPYEMSYQKLVEQGEHA